MEYRYIDIDRFFFFWGGGVCDGIVIRIVIYI